MFPKYFIVCLKMCPFQVGKENKNSEVFLNRVRNVFLGGFSYETCLVLEGSPRSPGRGGTGATAATGTRSALRGASCAAAVSAACVPGADSCPWHVGAALLTGHAHRRPGTRLSRESCPKRTHLPPGLLKTTRLSSTGRQK